MGVDFLTPKHVFMKDYVNQRRKSWLKLALSAVLASSILSFSEEASGQTVVSQQVSATRGQVLVHEIEAPRSPAGSSSSISYVLSSPTIYMPWASFSLQYDDGYIAEPTPNAFGYPELQVNSGGIHGEPKTILVAFDPPASEIEETLYTLYINQATTASIDTEYNIEVDVISTPTSCYASDVYDFSQGFRLDFKPIGPIRSDAFKALGAPQENNRWNFVSLGFGGSLTLKLGANIYDDGTTDPDLMLVETTWGWSWRSCYTGSLSGTPETVRVELSADGINWLPVPGNFCRNAKVDISDVVSYDGTSNYGKLPYARYIRLTDTSNPADFSGSANGYDVDGIILCKSLFDNMATNSRNGELAAGTYNPNFFNTAPDTDEAFSALVYPQPATDAVNIKISSPTSQEYSSRLISLEGRIVQQDRLLLDVNNNELILNLQQVKQGIYVLELTDQLGEKFSSMLVKQ